MLTDADRAAAVSRYVVRLAAQPPPTDERVDRIAALFAWLRLRIARDRAREYARRIPELRGPLPASNDPRYPGVSPAGNTLLSGTEVVHERDMGGAGRV
jgi:hypothetical protein